MVLWSYSNNTLKGQDSCYRITLRVTTDLIFQCIPLVNGIGSCNQISFHYFLTTSVLLFNYQTETVEPLRGLWMSVHHQDPSWQTQGHCVLSVSETRKLHIMLDGNMIDAKDSCRELRSSRHAFLLFLQIERLIKLVLLFNNNFLRFSWYQQAGTSFTNLTGENCVIFLTCLTQVLIQMFCQYFV